MFRRLLASCFAMVAFTAPAIAGNVTVIGWNIEGGWRPDATLQGLAPVFRNHEADIWALSEVSAEWEAALPDLVGENGSFEIIIGERSGTDKVAIVYNRERLEPFGDPVELEQLRYGRGGRSPLFQVFQDRTDGAYFAVGVVHLHRSDANDRFLQSVGLNDWADGENLPLILMGDFNYDWNLSGTPGHDRGYDALTENGIWQWVRPATLVKTQCSPRYNSVLDFAFVANGAQQWASESEILERHPAFCNDTDRTSDHRPVRITVDVTGVAMAR